MFLGELILASGVDLLEHLFLSSTQQESDRKGKGSKYRRHSTEEFENTEDTLLFMTNLETQKIIYDLYRELHIYSIDRAREISLVVAGRQVFFIAEHLFTTCAPPARRRRRTLILVHRR